jgi:ABC-type dipeptide/oligopeptide/nickel transport system ATPase subunit
MLLSCCEIIGRKEAVTTAAKADRGKAELLVMDEQTSALDISAQANACPFCTTCKSN